MIIMGVDPGSRYMGYGILDGSDSDISYVDSGVCEFFRTKNFTKRCGEIYARISELLMQYKPSIIAIEGLVYVRNKKSLIQLSQARGAMLASFAENSKATVHEYSPNLVKASVSHYGHADKNTIQTFVRAHLSVSEFSSDDESDALAVALCYWFLRDN